MDGISTQPDNRGFNSTVEKLVDTLFACLKLVFPSSFNATLKHPEDEAAAKRQWIAAFLDNTFTTNQK
ncbi:MULTISPECIES: replication protein P [Pantoea]|uniref:replication protein P n=1 Tax=Pantoea TaxID=53335 RepID=UPI0028931278|nr:MULTISPECIES: replication protein P [Pantoea]